MSERFREGDRVRTSAVDPDHHTRLPGYARGRVGVVIGDDGVHPLADLRARGIERPQPVYLVRFTARELFGQGDHTVTLSLWEEYLSDE
ncbi:nitrile hydratase [Lentzea atacamensis]|uniref:Nitrile hydratase n=1 Tax=Lentzea atacamensis TaxID=531938 RepID=A0ABX9E8P9_9PSEU|nr:SH3-like domain-containing protein [Lentzea atacamensis]RAS66073.1 nitrile hydratase [Lentzea atacamensis]